MGSSYGQGIAPLVLDASTHHPSASGIREVARQGGMSRLTLQNLHQDQRAHIGANEFGNDGFYALADRHHAHPTQQPRGVSDDRFQRGVEQFGAAWVAVPDSKTSKLMIQRFSGHQLYVGLGTGFREWAYSFLEALEMAEMASGYRWAERVKVNNLGKIFDSF